jgi:hypothetical protein
MMHPEEDTFQITKFPKLFLKRWPLILLLSVIGAITGFGISHFLPSRYEATAAIAVSVDFGRTEEIDLVTEERVLDRVRQLMVSDDTFLQIKDILVHEYHFSDEWDSLDEFRENFRLDARLSRWEMIGIHSDPEIATLFANIWQEVNLARLDDAMDHAWKAQSIQGVEFSIGCVLLLTGEDSDSIYQCVTVGPHVSQDVIEELRYEITESHGIIPIIQYESVHRATPPDRPALWPRGLLVFSGGMMGFIIGFLIAIKPNRANPDDFIST